MVATAPTSGKGTVVRIGRGSTPVWTTLARVGDVTFPSATIEELDVTAQDSPGNAMEFIAGLTDNGLFAVPMQYLPDSPTDVMLRAILLSGEIVQIEITPKGGTLERWAGFLKQYERSAPVKSVQQMTATFRVNGTIP